MPIHISTKALFVTSCLLYMYIGLVPTCVAGANKNQQNACSKDTTPCYNYTLTFMKDGIWQLLGNRSEIVGHHEKAGRSEAQAIMEGHMATVWFKNKYGIDFTNVPDEVYLDGAKAVTNSDRTLTFRPYIVSASAHQRLISASRRDKAEFLVNSEISEAGWMVTANEDYTTTGEFNGVIPKGAAVLYGDYVFKVCRAYTRPNPNPVTSYRLSRFYNIRPCTCLLEFHYTPLVIHYESNTYFGPMGNINFLDHVVKETTLGVGVARGVLVMISGNKVDSRNVLTFPGTV